MARTLFCGSPCDPPRWLRVTSQGSPARGCLFGCLLVALFWLAVLLAVVLLLAVLAG